MLLPVSYLTYNPTGITPPHRVRAHVATGTAAPLTLAKTTPKCNFPFPFLSVYKTQQGHGCTPGVALWQRQYTGLIVRYLRTG